MTTEEELCGYGNCFRPFYKMRGFMPCCELHYNHPKKWGEDGMTFTGSVFRKENPYPNHAKQVKRECNRFRKQADQHRPAERHHLYELIAEVEWLSMELLLKPEQATARTPK